MKIVVSACLVGENCKYNGKNNYNPRVAAFLSDKEFITVCPEVLAGLGVPRNCAEIVNGKVRDSNGKDIDAEYRRGVSLALGKIQNESIDIAILQSRSPTCGVRQVYDGSFSGTLIPGQGLLAKELIRKGFKVMDSADF